MSQSQTKLPLSRAQVIEMYFMEHRAKLIDIAAFLDRLDRADAGGDSQRDFRIDAFLNALKILLEGKSDRAKRVLELFSDPTKDPIPKAPMKGALGAYHPPKGQGT